MVKEIQYRKTVIEKAGMTKIERMIEIRHSKVTARFVFSQGKVSPHSALLKKDKAPFKHGKNRSITPVLE